MKHHRNTELVKINNPFLFTIDLQFGQGLQEGFTVFSDSSPRDRKPAFQDGAPVWPPAGSPAGAEQRRSLLLSA